MLSNFLKRLSGTAETPKTTEDERLALTALLVRIARANEDYAATEVAAIDDILQRRYQLDAPAAAALRADAEAVEAQASDTVRFTRTIKDNVDFEDREQVIEALWELVLADGERDADEEGILRLIAPLLGVNDRDSALARQRVEARLKNTK